MSAPYDVKTVEYLGGFRLRLGFADGLVGEVDLKQKVEDTAGPVFKPLRDPAYFARVTVDDEIGTIVWPNGADLAPEVLHEDAVPVSGRAR
ncbi:MAG TPA: DUF2442 domain-containing protein [Acidimicrobiia bacterium]|jgi:hypothetical protein